MDYGQHLVDYAVRFVSEMDQDFAPIVGMAMALNKTSAFKCVEQ
jgi:hypothetical protein